MDKLTNAMGVLLNAAILHRRKVVVDDVHDVAHINATGSSAGRDENRALAAAESTHGGLSLDLVALAVHRGAWHVILEEEVINLLNSAPRVDKDDGARGRQRLEEVKERLFLQVRLDPDDALLDVLVRTASTANPKANMGIREVRLCEIASALREGGGEEQVIDITLFLFCSQVRP